LDPNAVREIQQLFSAQQPQQPQQPVQNVQEVMNQHPSPDPHRNVSRRLFGPETDVTLHDFIVAGRRVIRVARLCTVGLNYDYTDYGVRYDECNPATRFVICNGVNQTRDADAGL